MSEQKKIDEESKKVAIEMKEKVEKKINKTFSIYEPICFKSKIMGGKIYLIKIKVDNDYYIHIKVHKLPNQAQEKILIYVQENKTLNDNLE
jgi:uncharacterized protein YukJ